jgi:hypothetical protein
MLMAEGVDQGGAQRTYFVERSEFWDLFSISKTHGSSFCSFTLMQSVARPDCNEDYFTERPPWLRGRTSRTVIPGRSVAIRGRLYRSILELEFVVGDTVTIRRTTAVRVK